MSDGDRGERDQDLNRGLGVVAAIILVALTVGVISYSSGVERERRNQYPPAYAESAKQDAAKACIGGEAGAVFECVYERVEASHDQARAEQDLNAQLGMKFWAAVMAAISLGTLAVTIVGVWY